ncbi:MAG: histone deacetylase family protein [Hyphomicrobiaceae bacterium]
MTTLLLTHPVCLTHDMGAGHPEQPDRLRGILKALEDPRFAGLRREESPVGTDDLLRLAHPEAHIRFIRETAPKAPDGFARIDEDTAMSHGTLEAALRAVGGGATAVDQVMAGKAKNAFLAVRPPGHHAEPERAMGFCFFSTAAIAALYAKQRHGLERVALVDFDVHHGNGSQAVLWSAKDVFFGSSHQMPLYPGTGAPTETGASGNIVNAPLRPGEGRAAFREAWTSRILPALDHHGFDLLLISAGFDAHRDDPLAQINLVEEDFAWITEELCEAAEKRCNGRVVSFLEGGYDLAALARSVAAHVGVLMEAGA